ncbi:hypothetical protein A2397_00450 [Candidatus Amesbacteria bacterium RIFOXYB1_FULL_44_23]|uniref:F-type ATPase subunit delta n=1 Tax=Candidatus Amesbacteria bacterium RIFOXYB1_FULL_44_23 TaxID=1797263 RepID=A0A1F4ZTV5_9BACT|nr:MAG: hypothetical protein A2397_00450 [Candidatus Amesbacteria bacterium RIFOXYB1_FULL_44_23]
MISENTQEILNGIILKSEAVDWLRELDVLDQSVYKTDATNFVQTLEKEVNSKLSLAIMNELKIKGDGIEARAEALREIRDGVNSLPEIKLEVAVDLPTAMIKRISKWLKENVAPGIVLDITENEEIMAGVRITYLGRYVDLSAEKNWTEVWKQVTSELVTKGETSYGGNSV